VDLEMPVGVKPHQLLQDIPRDHRIGMAVGDHQDIAFTRFRGDFQSSLDHRRGLCGSRPQPFHSRCLGHLGGEIGAAQDDHFGVHDLAAHAAAGFDLLVVGLRPAALQHVADHDLGAGFEQRLARHEHGGSGTQAEHAQEQDLPLVLEEHEQDVLKAEASFGRGRGGLLHSGGE
jgi:hypothetical protein